MSQLYQLSEVAEQNGKKGKPVWVIYKGNVYDVTKFLDSHPGGGDLIQDYGGKDCTKAFNNAGHSSEALRDLKQYKIGELAPTPAPQPAATAVITKAAEAKASEANVMPAEKQSSGIFCCC